MMTIQEAPAQTGRSALIAGAESPNESCLLNFAADIPKSIAQVYESVPGMERSRLLTHLLTPLGVLSLVAVANGIFAGMLFRSGAKVLHIRPEDAQNVRFEDVVALIDHVQQVSVESVESLALVLTAGSAQAALLVTMLLQRAKNRRTRASCVRKFSGGISPGEVLI